MTRHGRHRAVCKWCHLCFHFRAEFQCKIRLLAFFFFLLFFIYKCDVKNQRAIEWKQCCVATTKGKKKCLRGFKRPVWWNSGIWNRKMQTFDKYTKNKHKKNGSTLAMNAVLLLTIRCHWTLHTGPLIFWAKFWHRVKRLVCSHLFTHIALSHFLLLFQYNNHHSRWKTQVLPWL